MSEEKGSNVPDEIKIELPPEVTGDEVETPSSEEGSEKAQFSVHEERAIAKGWKPKEEFEGNPDDWRPAKEWLERGELFDKIKHVSKEAFEAKQALSNFYGEFVKYRQTAFTEALKTLKQEKQQAMREGDFDKLSQVEEQLEKTQQEHAQELTRLQSQAQQVAQSAQPPDTREFDSWVERNTWYTQDRDLRDAADTAAMNFIRERGGRYSASELGEYVETTIKRRFPDKFRRQASGPPSPDSQGKSQQSGSHTKSNPFAKIEASMSEEERKIMTTIIKHGGVSKEQYMKDYVDARGGR